MAYYSLAVHDPKNRDLAEILRMLSYQMERILQAIPEDAPSVCVSVLCICIVC